MICAALEAEVEDYVGSLVEQVDEHGHRLVRRNGRAQERRMTVGLGTVAPRHRASMTAAAIRRPGSGSLFLADTATLRAPLAEGLRRAAGALPAGALDRRLRAALRELLGEEASGLSASSIGRLAEQWRAEHEAFRGRRLEFTRYAYCSSTTSTSRSAWARTTRSACWW